MKKTSKDTQSLGVLKKNTSRGSSQKEAIKSELSRSESQQSKKSRRPKGQDFDTAFDNGEIEIDFSRSKLSKGFDELVILPPIKIPAWIAIEIEKISKHQANSKASIVRQLLVGGIEEYHRAG